MTMIKRISKKTVKGVNRRGVLLFGAQIGFMGILAARLRYLQVDQGKEYRLLAEENRINIRLLPPARGLIFDRNWVPVAENNQNYRIVMVREQAGNVRAVLDRLRQIIPISDKDYAAVLKSLKRRPAFVPVTIAQHLTWTQLSEVSANAPALPGVTAGVGLTRYYPQGRDFAHIVGYVGPVSDYDLKHMDGSDPLLQIPKFQVGKSGVESKVERQLRGFAGTERIEVNAVGRVMREISRQKSEAGAKVQLTIDEGLQDYVQARLAGQSAAAVVIDVNTGDIMAMGSTPSFDPNKFVTGISVPDYRALITDPYRPLANKAVQGTYPPGSTFKPIVALAALEGGFVNTTEKILCVGYITVGKRRFHGWKRSGHGWVNLNKSLKESCDIYYYEMAMRVGIKKMAEMARRFGLGERPVLPLNGIAEGLIPTKAWKRRVVGEPWRIGDSLNTAIGQGFVLSSPLQLAVMAARIASGKAVEPRLLLSIGGVETPRPEAPDMGISAASFAAVRGGMFAVSNELHGTAYSTRIAIKSLRMAGKTGTSQVRSITKAERARGVTKNIDLPWKDRDHALFIAYAPYDKPKYAVAVIIEHGGGGSSFAAPVARDALLQALFNGLPPLDAYPRSQRVRIEKERKVLDLSGPASPPAPTPA